MSRLTNWQALAVTLLAACSQLDGAPKATAGGASSLQVRLRVRDSETGLPIAGASVGSRSLSGERRAPPAQMDPSGRGAQEIDSGGSMLEVSAAGYAPLRAGLAAGSTGEVQTFWLDPVTPSPALSAATLAAVRRPGMALLHGHVLDDETGQPLSGATIELARSGLAARTDATGYFALQLPGRGASTPDDLPPTEDLVVRADGFVTDRLKDVALFESDLHFIVDLKRGNGQVEHDYGHKLVSGTDEPPGDPLDEEEVEEEGTTLGVSTYALTAKALYLLDPPDSITVNGFGTMSLETYVGNGIANEWIASWPASALMAGTVAYRSYGVSYQNSSGSICATSSCQVYKGTSNAAGKAAAQATSGIMLTSTGSSAARSEYSAENNASKCSSYSCSNSDLSCGSGKAGSPGAGWPCLDDAHSFSSGPGTCCFGHGRGMCQWGTAAWAKVSKNWSWMVDHYYNDEGSGTGKRTLTMTSPIEVTTASVSPGSASPGDDVSVSVDLRSYAEGDHSQTLLRASLVLGAADPIPNPSGVTQVTVSGTAGQASKTTAASQTFPVGASLAVGTYDLLVEVFLDTNGDKSVDSGDLLLATKTVAGALAVVAVAQADAGSGPVDSGGRPDASASRDAGAVQASDAGAAQALDAGAAQEPDAAVTGQPPAVVGSSCGCSTSGASVEGLLLVGALFAVLARARSRGQS